MWFFVTCCTIFNTFVYLHMNIIFFFATKMHTNFNSSKQANQQNKTTKHIWKMLRYD